MTEAKADRPITVHIDEFDPQATAGWAYGESDPEEPVVLELHVDGGHVETLVCADERPDVAAHSGHRSTVGFRTRLPARFFDDGEHEVEIRAPGPAAFYIRGVHATACTPRLRLNRFVPQGNVDGFRNGAVQGWLFVTDNMTGGTAGRQEVLVSVGGNPAAQILANGFRPDVAHVHGCDAMVRRLIGDGWDLHLGASGQHVLVFRR